MIGVCNNTSVQYFVYVFVQFMRDASEVMDMLLKTQTGDLQDDDPQTSYLISAWARICKILGQYTGLKYSTKHSTKCMHKGKNDEYIMYVCMMQVVDIKSNLNVILVSVSPF